MPRVRGKGGTADDAATALTSAFWCKADRDRTEKAIPGGTGDRFSKERLSPLPGIALARQELAHNTAVVASALSTGFSGGGSRVEQLAIHDPQIGALTLKLLRERRVAYGHLGMGRGSAWRRFGL